MEIWGVGAVTYVVSFPQVLKTVRFPVIGCLEVPHSAVRMRKKIMYRHIFSRVALVQ